MAVCLMAAACGSSKSGGSPSTPTTTLPQQTDIDEEGGNTRGRGTPTQTPSKEDVEPQINTGSGTQFDENITQPEMDALIALSKDYSGSADDSLRELLISRADREADSYQRARNLRFANSIITVREKLLKPTSKTAQAQRPTRIQVIVRMLLGGKEQELNLSGSLASQKKGNKIALVSKGKDNELLKNLYGELICMDESRPQMANCETKIAHIYLNKAYAQVILRKSDFHLHGNFKNVCMTADCENVYGLLKNSEDGLKSGNSVSSKSMETFEIIQGRSAFNIVIYTFEREVVKMLGNLPHPKFNDNKENPLDTKLDTTVTEDESKGGQYKTKMNASLSDVRLQHNEGDGNLRIHVRMKILSKADRTRDSFDLEVSRTVKPIRALTDEDLQMTAPQQAQAQKPGVASTPAKADSKK